MSVKSSDWASSDRLRDPFATICRQLAWDDLDHEQWAAGRCQGKGLAGTGQSARDQHAIWLYLRFTMSYPDVEDLLVEETEKQKAASGGGSGMMLLPNPMPP